MEPSVELVGVLHLHTCYSDGTATPAELVQLAANQGLDFIGINDHRNLKARQAGWAGLRDGVTVLAGSELNDPSLANHILVYGSETIPPVADSSAQLAHLASAGGLAIVAHPCERGTRLPKMGPYPWKHGPLPGIGGVEVWNYMSDWKTDAGLRDMHRRIKNPDSFVGGPNSGAVELWLKTGGCVVGGVDAHGLRFGVGRFRLEVFPYSRMMEKLHCHVLLDAALPTGAEERTIVDAIGRGRSFTSSPALGSARGFRFCRDGDAVSMDLPDDCTLRVRTVRGVLQRPVASGRRRFSMPSSERAFVELLKDGRTWICFGLD